MKKTHLNYLKALAAFFVVLGHCIAYLESYTDLPNYGRVLSVMVSSVHVPLFFTLAGYFCHKQSIGVYINKKINRLLFPFFFFTTIKFVVNIVFSSIGGGFSHSSSIIEELVNAFILGEYYWFIYCLFIIYLLAPLLWNRSAKTLLVVCITIYCINVFLSVYCINVFPEAATVGNISIHKPLNQVDRVLQYLPYFIAGLIIQKKESIIVEKYRKYKNELFIISSFILIFTLSLIWINAISRDYFIKSILAFCQMFIYYHISKATRKYWCILDRLGDYSLQVMLFDGFVRNFCFIILSKFVPLNMLIVVIIAFVEVVVTLLICELLKKFDLRFLNRLIGI